MPTLTLYKQDQFFIISLSLTPDYFTCQRKITFPERSNAFWSVTYFLVLLWLT